MSDSRTELLMQVKADLDQLKGFVQEVTKVSAGIATAANQAKQLDTAMESVTELKRIRSLTAKMTQFSLMQAEATRKKAASDRQAAAAAKQKMDLARAFSSITKQEASDTARVARNLKNAANEQKNLKHQTVGWVGAMKQGAGILAGMGLVRLAQRGARSIFQSGIVDGVKFNGQLETAALGVASVLKTFDPQEFKTFDVAISKSKGLIDDLKIAARESPASFSGLLTAFQGTAGAMGMAAIPLQKQVGLINNIGQAMIALGIRPEEMRQEATALLMGRIDRNARLAKTLGITAADINAAKKQGDLYGFLTDKLKEFAEAGTMSAHTMRVLQSNLGDILLIQTADATDGLSQSYKQLLETLTVFVSSDKFVNGVKAGAEVVGDLVVALTDLVVWSQRNSHLVVNSMKTIAASVGLLSAAGTFKSYQLGKSVVARATGKAAGSVVGEAMATTAAPSMFAKMKGILRVPAFGFGSWLGVAIGAGIVLAVGKATIDAITNARLKAHAIAEGKTLDAYGSSLSVSKQLGNARTRAEVDAIYDGNPEAGVKALSTQLFDAQIQDRAFRNSDSTATQEERDANSYEIKRLIALLADGMREIAYERAAENAANDAAVARGAILKANQANASEAALDYMATSSSLSPSAVRDSILESASGGTTEQRLAAIQKAVVSVNAEYDELASHAEFILIAQEKNAWLLGHEADRRKELAELAKKRDSLEDNYAKRQEAYNQALLKTRPVAEQIVALEERLAFLRVDGSRDAVDVAMEILQVEQEIAKLRDTSNAKELAMLEKRAANARAGHIASIQSNRFLTQKQKSEQLYRVYQAEKDGLPGQISALDGLAGAYGEDSPMRAQYTQQADTLRARSQTVDGDISANRPLSMMEEIAAKVVGIKDSFIEISDVIAGGFQSAIDGISSSMEGLIMGTMSWGEAFSNIAQTILGSVVGAISRMFAEWAVGLVMKFTLGKALQAAALASTVPFALAATALWTGPATLATIATLGGAAAAAPVEIAASMATTKTLALAGFMDGGFTPEGIKNQIAGVVHAGEWVAPQWMVNDPMAGSVIADLEMMRQGGQGYSANDLSVPYSQQSGASAGSSPSEGGGVSIAFYGARGDAEQWLRGRSGRKTLVNFMKEESVELT